MNISCIKTSYLITHFILLFTIHTFSNYNSVYHIWSSFWNWTTTFCSVMSSVARHMNPASHLCMAICVSLEEAVVCVTALPFPKQKGTSSLWNQLPWISSHCMSLRRELAAHSLAPYHKVRTRPTLTKNHPKCALIWTHGGTEKMRCGGLFA